MARTKQEIEDELNDVRCAIKAMLSTKEGNVGLRNVQDLGGRVEPSMRPTYAQLQQREKDLLAGLEAIIGRIGSLMSRQVKKHKRFL